MVNMEFLSLRLPEDIERYLLYGDFKSAQRLIDIYLSRNITEDLKKKLAYQKEIIRRLEADYLYDFEETLQIFQDKVQDFSRAELEFLKDERYTDWIFIDGEVRFHHRVLENTAKVHPGIRPRLREGYHEVAMEALTKATVEEIMAQGQGAYRIHLKKGLKLKDQYFIKNKKLRVHLPLPIEARHMSHIDIKGFSLEPQHLAGLDWPQRTAYFEEELNYNIPFTVDFSFESRVGYRELDYSLVDQDQPDFYLEEVAPHLSFTPYLVNLSRSLVGAETNPLKKARLIYNYISQNVQYSFMRSYACLDNIPEFAAYNLKGDCGVQALLFICLCRIAGVPARWQSGLVTNPHRLGAHDWAEFYVAPYGWLYADLSFGGMSLRLGEPGLWNYYFGHIDPFRLAFNRDIQRSFDPPKNFLREDPYDNQHGEMEYEDRGIYSHEYDIISEIISIEKI